jgi:hypothetical protein
MFPNLAIVNGGPPLCIYVVASVYVLGKKHREDTIQEIVYYVLCSIEWYIFHASRKMIAVRKKYFDRIMLGYIQGGAPLYS